MSVTGIFSKGRPAGHADATSILKYIPRARVPWQPSQFGRGNLDEADLARLWGMGRYRGGYGNYNSGYSTGKTHVLEDNTVNIIPKHELEKYMPDISIGPKALVTPVSLMSARAGHRVTHDMLHSYDPYIGRVQKPATVDHDNITVDDPNRVGLNAATLDCRGRIYRWLRRGPFFQEDFYFRRSLQLTRNGPAPVSAVEAPLMAKIVRLASKGHLKAACEEYRRVTTVPPVAVYRALLAACIPGGKLADAVAIFEDGNSRLFYVARDGEALFSLMRCAIKARHRARVMWVYNIMRGRYYENIVVRAEVDPIWRYRIATLAMEFLLDASAGEEARAIYDYLCEEDLVDCDVHARMGLLMQEALAAGKTVSLLTDRETARGLALVQNSEAVAPAVAQALYQRYAAELREQAVARATNDNSDNGGDADAAARLVADVWASTNTTAASPLPPPPPSAAAAAAAADVVAWLKREFSDINVMAVLRLARFRHGRRDLMAKDRRQYVGRAAQWVELLSTRHQCREEAPLPYLRKSRASLSGGPSVRVAWLPERRLANAANANPSARLLAHEEGYTFVHAPNIRLVEETFAYAGNNTLQAKYLAQRPLHREVPVAAPLFPSLVVNNNLNGKNSAGRVISDGRRGGRAPRILHSSVHAVVSSGDGYAPAAAYAGGVGGAIAAATVSLVSPSRVDGNAAAPVAPAVTAATGGAPAHAIPVPSAGDSELF